MNPIKVEKLHSLTGHRDCVYTLSPSDSADYFFSAGGDGMVVRWDLNQPEEGEVIAKLSNSIYALHAIPKSNLLVAGHNYEGIHVLDWKSKTQVTLRSKPMKETIPDILAAIAIGIGLAVLLASWWST